VWGKWQISKGTGTKVGSKRYLNKPRVVRQKSSVRQKSKAGKKGEERKVAVPPQEGATDSGNINFKKSGRRRQNFALAEKFKFLVKESLSTRLPKKLVANG